MSDIAATLGMTDGGMPSLEAQQLMEEELASSGVATHSATIDVRLNKRIALDGNPDPNREKSPYDWIKEANLSFKRTKAKVYLAIQFTPVMVTGWVVRDARDDSYFETEPQAQAHAAKNSPAIVVPVCGGYRANLNDWFVTDSENEWGAIQVIGNEQFVRDYE